MCTHSHMHTRTHMHTHTHTHTHTHDCLWFSHTHTHTIVFVSATHTHTRLSFVSAMHIKWSMLESVQKQKLITSSTMVTQHSLRTNCTVLIVWCPNTVVWHAFSSRKHTLTHNHCMMPSKIVWCACVKLRVVYDDGLQVMSFQLKIQSLLAMS